MGVFNASWPLSCDSEIEAEHFNDIRKLIYLLDHPRAGWDNNTPFDNSSWEAPFDLDLSAGHEDSWETFFDGNDVLAPGYHVVIETGGWKEAFILIKAASKNTLKNSKPLSGSSGSWTGLNTTYWRLGFDWTSYEDFDYCAGRDDLPGDGGTFRKRWRVVGFAKAYLVDPDGYWDYRCPNYYILPRQVDNMRQKHPLKDGEGTITRQCEPLELGPITRKYITQLMSGNWDTTMADGPADGYGVQSGWRPNCYSRIPTGFAVSQGDCCDVGGTITERDEGDGSIKNSNWQSTYCNKLICEAYQDRIIQCLSLHERNYYFDCDDEYEEFWNDVYNNDLTLIGLPCGLDPDCNDEYDPENIKGQPVWDAAYDLFFQCNESGFEKVLKELGHFDWIWDTTHPAYPEWLLNKRDEWKDDGKSDGWINARLPLPEGCWRRVWKWSFGGLGWESRINNDTAYPGTSNPPDYYPKRLCVSQDTYDDTESDYQKYYQAVSPSGDSSTCAPDFSLSEEQKNTLREHHLEVQSIDGEDEYEIPYELVNDLWYGLNKYHKVRLQWPYEISFKKKHIYPTANCTYSPECPTETTKGAVDCLINGIENDPDIQYVSGSSGGCGYIGSFASGNGVGTTDFDDCFAKEIYKALLGVEITLRANSNTPYILDKDNLEFRIGVQAHECYTHDGACEWGYKKWETKQSCNINFEGLDIASPCLAEGSGAGDITYHKVTLETPDEPGDTLKYWTKLNTDWDDGIRDWFTFTPVDAGGSCPNEHKVSKGSWYSTIDMLLYTETYGVGHVDWDSYPSSIFEDNGRNFETQE